MIKPFNDILIVLNYQSTLLLAKFIMKKFLTTFFIINIVISVYAQKLYLIPKVGIALSMQTNNLFAKDKTGFTFGSALEYKISNLFSLQTEISYVEKGFMVTNVSFTDNMGAIIMNDFKIRNNYNYLELPILGKLNFGNEKVKFYLCSGPSFSYYIYHKIKGIDERYQLFSYITDEDIKKFNFSWQVGLGLKLFILGPGAIVLDARYDKSFTSFYKSSMNSDIKNNYFAFNLGYSFPLGKK